MTESRIGAIRALDEILNKGVRPKPALASFDSAFDKRDRSFLMELVYGVLRYRDTVDWILNHFLKNPSRLAPMTLINLRVSAYQIFYMRVPDRAAVHEAVEFEKNIGTPSLVNAVLRNILRQRQRFTLPLGFSEPIEDIAVNTSHPSWMVRRWIKRFGIEDARALCQTNNTIPQLTIRTNTLRISRDELSLFLLRRGIESSPTRFSPDGLTITSDCTPADLAFAEGLFMIQDESSQIIPYLLAPKPGERILDACAAPGGKTTHIAQLMKDAGEIIAVEKDDQRIEKLHENIRKLGIRIVSAVRTDALELGSQLPFDRILIDAPCSSTGVIRRNPDIKYRYHRRDIAAMAAKQLELMAVCSRYLKINGVLVYSICSIEPEEGENVLNQFLKTAGNFRIIDTAPPPAKLFMNNGLLSIYPHRYPMDGFFGVALCRIK